MKRDMKEMELDTIVVEVNRLCKSLTNGQNRVRCNAALYWLRKIDVSYEVSE